MALKTSISVLKDAVVGFTGGTAVTYTNNGKGFNGANILVNTATDDPLKRESILTRTVTGATPVNDKALAKLHRAYVSYREPFTATGGKVYSGVGADFSVAFHPEQTLAQRQAVLARALAIAGDAEMADLLTKLLDN